MLFRLHVKGHAGHPWNEAADTLARLVAEQIRSPLSIPFDAPNLVGSSERAQEWAVEFFCGHLNHPAFPPVCDGSFVVTAPLPNALPVVDDVPPPAPDRRRKPRSSRVTPVVALQLNVLSLGTLPDPDDRSSQIDPLRIHHIERHLHDLGVNISGMQEHRQTGPTRRTLEHYHLASHAVPFYM